MLMFLESRIFFGYLKKPDYLFYLRVVPPAGQHAQLWNVFISCIKIFKNSLEMLLFLESRNKIFFSDWKKLDLICSVLVLPCWPVYIFMIFLYHFW